MQTFQFAVFDDASQNIQNATGPIDDGYIANAVGSLPGDPLCCAGPEPLDDGKPAAPADQHVFHYLQYQCTSSIAF